MAVFIEQARKLLDFNQGLDIGLLDSFVSCMYSGSGDEQRMARDVLTALKEHPQSWLFVKTIIEESQNQETRYYGLQILESVIRTRWKTLSRQECEVIKSWITGLIIVTSSESGRAEREKVFLGKLNTILVLIVEREWPNHWPNFVAEIVGASNMENQSLCKNNLAILKLLSEEVFDFSLGKMTQLKAKHFKEYMLSELPDVLKLFQYIMGSTADTSFLGATLETLLRFLSWIPLGFTVQTELVPYVIHFMDDPFLSVTLKCLTEMAGSAAGPQYDDFWVALFHQTMVKLEQVLPININIKEAFAKGRDSDQAFIMDVALFLCTMLKQHGPLLEERDKVNNVNNVLKALEYMVLISEVEETEILKICLEYWNVLVADLYRESIIPAGGVVGNAGGTGSSSVRLISLKNILSRLRVMVISRMAKPEEVLVVENENGQVVREVMKNTSNIILYKSMRETLAYLTHLDYADTERILTGKLENQVNGSDWSWKNLNTLCWAVGSISGTMEEADEDRFLVYIIKELLNMCEQKKGKDNKAIIAANVMYVVSQYPRYLRAHLRFLRVVVNKLFEFMQESHDGVQDMACDTLLKITKKCKRQLLQVRVGEISFLEDILNRMNTIVSFLQPQQKNAVYEAVGHIVSAQGEKSALQPVIEMYMIPPNHTWNVIMNEAKKKVDVLQDDERVLQLVNIVKINVRACKALGHPYVYQLSKIYPDMINIYTAMSRNISGAIGQCGEQVIEQSIIKRMRLFKRETLNLITGWIKCCNDPSLVLGEFMDRLFEAVLADYHQCVPCAREPEVLSTLATIVNKLGGHMTSQIPRIFDAVFQCTLDMINQNFEEFPEHRFYLYQMLQAANNHCFPALLSSADLLKLVMDATFWGFKHTMRNVAELGLDILYHLLQNISRENPEKTRYFYKTYFVEVLQHVFSVVVDTTHACSLTMHAKILAYMFSIVEMGMVTVSLNSEAPAIPRESLKETNILFVKNLVFVMFHNAFPHLTQAQLNVTVEGLVSLNQDVNRVNEHLRDILVQIKEFTGDDTSDLFLEERELELRKAQEEKRKVEMSVPGILNPYEFAEDMQN